MNDTPAIKWKLFFPWLAQQPATRTFDYWYADKCLIGSFVTETHGLTHAQEWDYRNAPPELQLLACRSALRNNPSSVPMSFTVPMQFSVADVRQVLPQFEKVISQAV